ncbi:hypothetical protein ES707_22136 [subsurface metagenome]
MSDDIIKKYQKKYEFWSKYFIVCGLGLGIIPIILILITGLLDWLYIISFLSSAFSFYLAFRYLPRCLLPRKDKGDFERMKYNWSTFPKLDDFRYKENADIEYIKAVEVWVENHKAELLDIQKKYKKYFGMSDAWIPIREILKE